MPVLNRARKLDLAILCDDWVLVVIDTSNVADIIKLVRGSECYDEDLSKTILKLYVLRKTKKSGKKKKYKSFERKNLEKENVKQSNNKGSFKRKEHLKKENL